MRSAIEAFYRKPDEGLTPYGAALRMAAAAINNDPDLNSPDSPTYDVIMISDGFPTDYSDRDGHFNEARMQQDLSALLQAATGRVSLSTIFYGQIEIPAAIDLLRALAQKGGGHFASVRDANSSFKIDDVIPNVGSCSP
jgi:Mg-chelatase subunit ChlD